ncbi:caspase family protein [Bradyrhizobium cenepequi]
MPAYAANRVALVIEDGAYQNVPLLPNPSNDAIDISAALQRVASQVKLLTNVSYGGTRRALIDFSRQAQGAEIAVIYFAGHRMIPVDAQLEADVNVLNEAIGLQSMTCVVSNTTKLGLVILDACRSNPFISKMRSMNVSYAMDEPSDNILLAYAARDAPRPRMVSVETAPSHNPCSRTSRCPASKSGFCSQPCATS